MGDLFKHNSFKVVVGSASYEWNYRHLWDFVNFHLGRLVLQFYVLGTLLDAVWLLC